MDRHIAIQFRVDGLPVLHYRADESAATAFAADMMRLRSVRTIRIDNDVTRDMRPLPCQRLFL